MNISELIELLEEHKEKYGNSDIKVRSHTTGEEYPIDYVTYWTKSKIFQIGIEKNSIKDK